MAEPLPSSHPDLEAEFVRLVKTAGSYPVVITMNAQAAVSVIACLQLSLRHPGVAGHHPEAEARKVIDRLIHEVSNLTHNAKRMAELLRMGDNAAQDVATPRTSEGD